MTTLYSVHRDPTCSTESLLFVAANLETTAALLGCRAPHRVAERVAWELANPNRVAGATSTVSAIHFGGYNGPCALGASVLAVYVRVAALAPLVLDDTTRELADAALEHFADHAKTDYADHGDENDPDIVSAREYADRVEHARRVLGTKGGR